VKSRDILLFRKFNETSPRRRHRSASRSPSRSQITCESTPSVVCVNSYATRVTELTGEGITLLIITRYPDIGSRQDNNAKLQARARRGRAGCKKQSEIHARHPCVRKDRAPFAGGCTRRGPFVHSTRKKREERRARLRARGCNIKEAARTRVPCANPSTAENAARHASVCP